MDNLQKGTYTWYNGKYTQTLTSYQQEILLALKIESLSKEKFAQIRSNARRYNNLERSIELATVNEIYKYEVRNGKKRVQES